jgi:hypothetical protein
MRILSTRLLNTFFPSAFLSSAFLLITLLLIFTACNSKKGNKKHFPETNNTEIFTKKDLAKNIFTIKSSQKKSYTFSISDKNISSDSFHKKTILFNISHMSSPSSLDQMESLSKIQTKYQSDVIVISLLFGDTHKITTPNIFLNKHHIYHFVSLNKENKKLSNLLYASLDIKDKPMPFTILYKNGKYYSHFEGSIPLEMLNYDLTQIIKK